MINENYPESVILKMKKEIYKAKKENEKAIDIDHPILRKESKNNGVTGNFRRMAHAAIESAMSNLENYKKILSDPEIISATKNTRIEGLIEEIKEYEKAEKELILFSKMIIELMKLY